MSTFALEKLQTAHCRISAPAPTHSGADQRNEVDLGTLAMSIVHDLRNPLAAVHIGAELLNGSPLPEHQVRRLARSMYSASVRIQELLQDYVNLHRTRERQPHSISLRSLVAQSVDRITAVAEAQSVVVVEEVPADLVVTVDRRQIGSVLANLLVNALEAMPTGGSIHISAVTAENSVVIRVLDNGPGIAAEIRDRLFQPFATARKANGWGLGLAQSRQVVIEHGGDMWLEPAPGGGACFAFSLPASPGGCQSKTDHVSGSNRLARVR
jgi:two-component system, NtrC family, sensor histidine kinase HydH